MELEVDELEANPICFSSNFCGIKILSIQHLKNTYKSVFTKVIRTAFFFASCRGKNVTTGNRQIQVGSRKFLAQFEAIKKILNTLSSYQ